MQQEIFIWKNSFNQYLATITGVNERLIFLFSLYGQQQIQNIHIYFDGYLSAVKARIHAQCARSAITLDVHAQSYLTVKVILCFKKCWGFVCT